MELIKFVIYSTLLLAIAFGIAWPSAQWAKKSIERWDAMPGTRKIVKSGLLILIGGLVIVAGVIDILVNYITGTIVFQELPNKGDYYLTSRIQRYLDELANVERPELYFSWYQHLYIKLVVTIANKIDRTPHFKIPKNVTV